MDVLLLQMHEEIECVVEVAQIISQEPAQNRIDLGCGHLIPQEAVKNRAKEHFMGVRVQE